ncbi:MAG: hypothetical protein AAB636_00935 [Patescibacteria group bacterium]
MDDLLTPEELTVLAKKVKDGTATEEETLQYLDIANGLAGEFLEAIKSMPTDEELAVTT